MAKLPAFQFYPGDWLKDPNLRICSLAAKGLWIDLLCYMHESTERGVLSSSGVPWRIEHVIRACGSEAESLLNELVENQVIRTRESDGAFYCQRMVKDESVRHERAKAGAKGGKSSLESPGFAYAIARATDGAIKLGASKAPTTRRSQLASRLGDELTLVKKWSVKNMLAAEKVIHARFISQRIDGEWFMVDREDLSCVQDLLVAHGIAGEIAGEIARAKSGSSSSSSVSSSNKKENTKRKKEGDPELYSEEFEQFWEACPRKVGKGNAWKVWKPASLSAAASKNKSPTETVAEFLTRRMRDYAAFMADKDAQFIRHPATWLNGGNWDDEVGSRVATAETKQNWRP